MVDDGEPSEDAHRPFYLCARSLEERDDGVDVLVLVPVVGAPVPPLPLLRDALLRERDQYRLVRCHFFRLLRRLSPATILTLHMEYNNSNLL